MRKWTKGIAVVLTASILTTAGYTGGQPAALAEVLSAVGTLVLPDSLPEGTCSSTVTVGEDTNPEFTPYPMQVQVVVSQGAISEITYTGAEGEDASYAQQAYEGIAPQIVGQGAGEVQIDGVSGATYSSRAFVDAVNQAVEQQLLLAPKIKSVQAQTKGMKVSWSEVDGAEEYILYRNGKKIKTLADTAYTDTKARTNGKKYTYKVVAVAGDVKSEAGTAKAYYMAKTRIFITLNGSAGKLTFAWEQNKKSSGYQVQCATKKNFKKPKVQNIKGKDMTITTLSSLKAGKSYYIRVRAYKKVGSKKYYAPWSATKKVRIKK